MRDDKDLPVVIDGRSRFVLVSLLPSAAAACGADGAFARRAVLIHYPYTSDDHVERTKKIAETAGAHGYNTAVFASSVGLGMSHVWSAAPRNAANAPTAVNDRNSSHIGSLPGLKTNARLIR